MKKYILVVVFSWGFPIAVFFGLALLSLPRAINDNGHRLMCENTLKAIGAAVELYRADNDGQFPPSLVEVQAYLKGEYCSSSRVPCCPGERGEDETSVSSPYIYHVPSGIDGIEPVCWDSKPHTQEVGMLPDTFRWSVLYTDGHVESLSDREFVRVMAASFADEPAVLGRMRLPDRPKDHRGRTFILGAIVGMTGLGLFLRITRGEPVGTSHAAGRE